MKGGIERHIHILGPVLSNRLKTGDHREQIIAIRRASSPKEKVSATYRHIEIMGPSHLLDTPEKPLPNTDRRAICYLTTVAPIKVYRD